MLQNVFALFTTPIPRSVMLGSGFHTFFRELNKTQWYKPEKLKKLQERRLRLLIEHAYYNVPYYNKIFKNRDLRPGDVKTIEDLKQLPILNKDDLRDHFHELVAMNAREFGFGEGRTSGSTGKPLVYYLDQQNREIEYATHWRQRKWAGVGFNSRVASFRGFRGSLRWIDFQSGKPCWKFNAFSKELEFNVFGIDKARMKRQIERLRKLRPHLIEGYPSAVEMLARYILENHITGISPLAVQTSSETLSKLQTELIKEAFGCRIFDWYSQSEYVVAAGQCTHGSYHSVESGIMEFIKDGEQVEEGEIGEIVGTSLFNYSMPFIRYRITDLGRFSNEKCGCGRGLPTIQSLEGRVFDSIITPDGKLLTGVSVELYWHDRISHFTPNVEHVHIIQKARNKLLIEMVKKESYSNQETEVILSGLRSLLGPEIQIEFKDLDSIPSGRKWRFTESELNISLI